jgi:hypothetical protein
MAQVPGAFIQTADVTFDNALDLVLQVEANPGFAVVDYGVLPAEGGTATGLVGATTYTASANVDGTPRAISILGSAAQTFTTLIAEINTDISTWATAALVGGKLVITSLAATASSSVVITDGSGSTALFANVKGANFGLVSVKSTPAALVYVRYNSMDGALQDEWEAKAAVLSPTQTFKTYASDAFTVAGTGVVAASPMSVAAATYDLTVTVNSVPKSVAVAVVGGETFATFLTKFNTALKVAFPALTATVVATSNLLTFNVTTNVPGNVATAVPAVTAGSVLDLIAALTAVAAPIDFTAALVAGTAGTEGTVGTSSTPAAYKALLLSTKANTGTPMWTLIPPGAFFTRRGTKPAARGNARLVNVYYNGSAWVDYTTDLAIA